MNIREVPQQQARYGVDPYLDWLKGEGIPVVEDYGVYLFDVETAPWPRYGVNGAAVHLKGRGDFANMFVFDIAPGKSTAPQRHLYEEVIYVLEGSGTFSAGDGIRPIGPGSQIELPARTVHCLENTGQGVMRLVAVFRPAGSPAHAYYPDGSPAYPGTPPLAVINDNPHHP